MIRKFLKVLVCAQFLLSAGLSMADTSAQSHASQSAAPAVSDRQRVADLLRLAPADIEVRKLPGSNLIEVVHLQSRELIYVDDLLRYVIQGSLLDSKSGTNVTDERRDEITAVEFSSLPLDKAIRIVHGNGSRRVAVFEDPDCPFCRRLEKDIAGLENATIYVLLFPLTQLHPDALARATSIYCAEDRGHAWLEYLQHEVEPPKLQCTTPMSDISDFAQKIGVTGTPTLIFEDGRRAAGAIPLGKIEAFLMRATARVAESHSAGEKAPQN
jgi:thiol:disulfide interchange protein DsbC